MTTDAAILANSYVLFSHRFFVCSQNSSVSRKFPSTVCLPRPHKQNKQNGILFLYLLAFKIKTYFELSELVHEHPPVVTSEFVFPLSLSPSTVVLSSPMLQKFPPWPALLLQPARDPSESSDQAISPPRVPALALGGNSLSESFMQLWSSGLPSHGQNHIGVKCKNYAACSCGFGTWIYPFPDGQS